MALLHCVPTLLQPRQSAPLLQQVHKVSFSAWCRSMTHQFSRIQHRADITLLWILCFIPSGASSYTLANTAVSLHHHTYWATSITTCLSPSLTTPAEPPAVPPSWATASSTACHLWIFSKFFQPSPFVMVSAFRSDWTIQYKPYHKQLIAYLKGL